MEKVNLHNKINIVDDGADHVAPADEEPHFQNFAAMMKDLNLTEWLHPSAQPSAQEQLLFDAWFVLCC